MNNISKLMEFLSDDTAYLIENPLNLRYFTDSSIDTGYLLIIKENAYFITDFRYIETAKKHFSNGNITVVLQNKLSNNIRDLMILNDVKKLCFENEFQTISKYDFYKNVTDEIVTNYSLDKAIADLRIVKSEVEIKFIKEAQKITDEAFLYALTIIKPGLKERDLALEIEFFMRKSGAEGVSFDLITISGNNTSLPHGIPSEKQISEGDFVTMDIGCKVNGYCSDMTRTVAVGFATDEMKKVYEIVLNAQLLALKSVRSGIPASEVDKAARDYIYSNGYDGCFGHSTGHGVGLFIHEPPSVSTSSKTNLTPGMIITVEPGIYLENQFGVRTEDMVVVTKDGCENLTQSSKELIIL